MPKQDPVLIEKINRLTEEISDYETRIKAKEIEIRSKGEKLVEITNELNQLKTKNGITLKELENLNSKITLLEGQIEKIENDKVILTENHKKMIDNLDKLSDSYSSLSTSMSKTTENLESRNSRISEMESNIGQLNENIKQLNDKLFEITVENERILKEKMNYSEKSINEKMEMTKNLTEMKHTIQDYETKIKELKKKVKSSGEGLLGHSMEIDKLKKTIDDKDKELEKMEGFLHGETGIFGDIKSVMDYVKDQFSKIIRSIRLVLPEISYLKDYGILPLIMGLNNKIIVNIAVPLGQKFDKDIIEELKEREAIITNTSEKNIFAMAIDGANLALGVKAEKGVDVRGVFTTIPELVTLFNAALMDPFVKGTKI